MLILLGGCKNDIIQPSIAAETTPRIEPVNKDADAMLAEAEQLCSKGNIDDLQKALDLCEKVLTQDPYSEKGIETLYKVNSKVQEYPEKRLKIKKDEDLRTFERWNPENATKEAEEDIKNNSIKIYMHGGFSSHALGISTKNDMKLIENLPKADAGVGCWVSDIKLRERQGIYSERYNKKILEHLTNQSN